jgi:hypothetical protein
MHTPPRNTEKIHLIPTGSEAVHINVFALRIDPRILS